MVDCVTVSGSTASELVVRTCCVGSQSRVTAAPRPLWQLLWAVMSAVLVLPSCQSTHTWPSLAVSVCLLPHSLV